MIKEFLRDVDQGLSSPYKTLPSKYFYDKKGDALFTDIMHMPEYYLTRAEFEILKEQSDAILKQLTFDKNQSFEIIELGAGDGKKTKEFLRFVLQKNCDFEYIPIDISQNVLDILKKSMQKDLPNLKIKTRQGDYFKVLDALKDTTQPKLVLFLGSNIGNLKDDKAQKFLELLSSNLNKGDYLLLGVDLIKPKEIVLPAYNDGSGITSNFNLNLLYRINRELEADFDVSAFTHQVEYDPEEGIVKSYLRSEKPQTVSIGENGKTYHLEKGERIHTEISRKYNDELIDKIKDQTHFDKVAKFTDQKALFADYLLVKSS